MVCWLRLYVVGFIMKTGILIGFLLGCFVMLVWGDRPREIIFTKNPPDVVIEEGDGICWVWKGRRNHIVVLGGS